MDRQPAYGRPAIQQLVKWVESTELHGLRGTDGDMREVPFVSGRALEDYFKQDDAVENLLGELFTDDDDFLERIDVRQIKKSFSVIFCLLILIDKGGFIYPFIQHGISDRCLPLDKHKPDNFPADPSDSHFFEKFFRHQWKFSVPELNVMHGRRFDMSNCILPIHRVERLGEGVSADIYKIEVPSDYDQLEMVRTLPCEVHKATCDTHRL